MRPGGAKQKGASGEYQVRDIMQPIVDEVYKAFGLTGPILERNLEQVRHGGSDLIGLDWIAVEVKWHKDRAINSWWAQVKEAALPRHHPKCSTAQTDVPLMGCPNCGGRKRVPVLVYRGNNEAWRVVMFGYLCASAKSPERVRAPVDISIEAFEAWLAIAIADDLESRGHKRKSAAAAPATGDYAIGPVYTVPQLSTSDHGSPVDIRPKAGQLCGCGNFHAPGDRCSAF